MAINLSRKKQQTFIPKSESLLAAVKLSTTPEAAQSLLDLYKEIVVSAKREDDPAIKSMILLIQENAQFATLSSPNEANPWGGEVATSRSEQYNESLEALAKQVLATKQINFTFAVAPDQPLLRGYSDANGDPLDSKQRVSMDVTFNKWLKSNELVNEKSMIFESTPDGKVKLDNNSKPIPVKSEDLKKRILDPQTGFESYVHRNVKDIDIKVVESKTAYPAQPAPSPGPEAGAGG